MRILVDTNFVITADPTRADEFEAGLNHATQCVGLANKLKYQLCVHPSQSLDINRDKDVERRDLRRVHLKRYFQLEGPFRQHEDLSAQFESTPEGENDWVDLQVINALACGAANILITDDKKMRSICARIGLENKVLRCSEAADWLNRLVGPDHSPKIPAISRCEGHAIDLNDPIFLSLADDYDFFEWFKKSCLQRHCLVVKQPGCDDLAGIAVLKDEPEFADGTYGTTLKICTFKIAKPFVGRRYGELLLKAIFDYIASNGNTATYLTAYPEKQVALIDMLEQFGFFCSSNHSEDGELCLIKKFVVPTEPAGDALDLHIDYGPAYSPLDMSRIFAVPIQPEFHRELFPDYVGHATLFPEQSTCGNGIRKAYLCHAGTNKIKKGDILLFYFSKTDKFFTALGICEEDPIRSGDADEIVAFVGTRTLFSADRIAEMCTKKMLVIPFRQVLLLKPRVSLADMKKSGAITDHPQTIVELKQGKLTWLKNTLKEQFYSPSFPSTQKR